MSAPDTTDRAAVVVVGSVNIDYVLRTPRLPGAGETLIGDTFTIAHGGKGANQAVASARLGARTRLIACVGDDASGQSAIDTYRKDGLPIDSIVPLENTTTGSAMIFVTNNGENCIGICAGANSGMTVAQVEREQRHIAAADTLLIQLEIPLASVVRAAEIARENNTRVILNPAPASDRLPEKLLRNTNILTPNQTEAALLTGLPCGTLQEAARAAEALHELGPQMVIVTLGEQGAIISSAEGVVTIKAPAVKAIDTVAAGDTFNGALAVALSEGCTIRDAVLFANQAAAWSVTQHGAQTSIPYRKTLSRYTADLA